MKAKAIDASHPGLKAALDAGLQPRAADQLLAFYDEPHRHYHNRVHIREMFDTSCGCLRRKRWPCWPTMRHIDGYSFQSPGSGPEHAVFRLVKGGFRTVTGQIGRINRDHYQVLTSQATIGIRGTHYELLTCAPDQCRRSNGTAAPAGVHGAVFDGRCR